MGWFTVVLLIVGMATLCTTLSTGSYIPPRFITNKMCPFAQKVWIALEASGVKYELREISLYGPNGKPDWFWELNPKGTVPVLDCRDRTNIWTDSDVILDQIPHMIPGGEVLQPPTPEIELQVKEWRREINHMLPLGKRAIQQPSGSSRKLLGETLRRLDGMVVGPYLCGDQLTIADCAVFPFLWRLETEDHLSQCPNLKTWLGHCQINPAIRKTIESAWWWWW